MRAPTCPRCCISTLSGWCVVGVESIEGGAAVHAECLTPEETDLCCPKRHGCTLPPVELCDGCEEGCEDCEDNTDED